MDLKDFSLLVSPSYTTINASAGDTVITPIILKNLSLHPTTITMVFKQIKDVNSLTGEIQYVPSDQQFLTTAKNLLDQVEIKEQSKTITTIHIAPQQQTSLLASIKIPKNESDYNISIFFISNSVSKKTETTHSLVKPVLATHVLISTGKTKPQDISLTQFSSPHFLLHGPIPFTIKINNTGEHLIVPHASIKVTNMFGQTTDIIGATQLPILAHSTRSLTSITNNINMYQDTLGASNLLWDDLFLFGRYTATITISENNIPFASESIQFTVFPFHYVLFLFIIVYVLLGILERIKTKLR